MTPSYIFVIVFLMYVYQLLGDGPQWRIAIPALKKTCQKYWWTNILYINNFYPKVLVDEVSNVGIFLKVLFALTFDMLLVWWWYELKLGPK